MLVLILAAGESQRLRPLTAEIPKTLLKVGGRSMLERIVDAGRRCGLTQFRVVTGHGAAHVGAECARLQRESGAALEFSFTHIADYATCGNVCSFHAARDLFGSPFILINSDVVCDWRILEKLIAFEQPDALVIDDVKALGEEEMKVVVKSGRIRTIHKSVPVAEADGEYTGLLKLGASSGAALRACVQDTVDTAPGKYYEDALQCFIDRGGTLHKMSTGGLPAVEIDTPEDLAHAEAEVATWT